MGKKQKQNKFMDFIRNWVAPILYVIVTVIIAPVLIDYFFTLKPEIQKINDNIQKISCSLEEIENRYTKRDENGVDCKVGISSEMSENNVAVFENNKFGLKGADKIYVTNPYSKYNPTMVFIVNLKEVDKKNPSNCDIFLSKEAMEKLDINKSDFYKGIFNMKMRTEKKSQ
jgi:hypothetical protein